MVLDRRDSARTEEDPFLFLILVLYSMTWRKVPLVCLIIGVVFFMAGLHGIDNAWNMQYIECVNGGNYMDSSLIGYSYGKGDLYRNSVMVVFIGFFISAVSALFCAYVTNK